MQNIRTGGIVNVWTESEKNCGASTAGHGARRCAGLAHYLDVPVKLVRVVTVLSIFFGLAFITLVAYIILSFVLDPMPEGELARKMRQPATICSMPWMSNWPQVRSVT
jgi:phage shock protein PspC (stress-responsive transcriptional regulator)